MCLSSDCSWSGSGSVSRISRSRQALRCRRSRRPSSIRLSWAADARRTCRAARRRPRPPAPRACVPAHRCPFRPPPRGRHPAPRAPMPDAKTPWGGRFEKTPAKFLAEFGNSLPVDKRMWAEDIRGSIAHARMLAKQGVITEEDADAIEAGLSAIYREIKGGSFTWDLADEDVHMAIERVLTERIGPAGARLHTGRSRNDQVATDARLYAKRAAAELARGCGRATHDAHLACRGASRRRDAGLHAPAKGAAGAAQPSPSRVLVDARARPDAPASRPRGGRRAATGQRGPRGDDLSARSGVRRRAAWVLGGQPQLDGRGVGSRLPARPDVRSALYVRPTCHDWPKRSSCGRRRSSAS